MSECPNCERLTRELEAEKQVNDLAYTHPRHLIANRNTLRAALAELADETQAIMRGEHGADWADHFTPLFNLIERAKALSGEPSAPETCGDPFTSPHSEQLKCLLQPGHDGDHRNGQWSWRLKSPLKAGDEP